MSSLPMSAPGQAPEEEEKEKEEEEKEEEEAVALKRNINKHGDSENQGKQQAHLVNDDANAAADEGKRRH